MGGAALGDEVPIEFETPEVDALTRQHPRSEQADDGRDGLLAPRGAGNPFNGWWPGS